MAPSLNNAATEESSFQVDLRVHGVSQDDSYKDEERMIEMQYLVDRLQDGYRDKSIIKDLRDGQHRAVRTWRNSQNNSVSSMLEAFQIMKKLLRMR